MPIPNGWNRYPETCQFCDQYLPPGTGPIIRNKRKKIWYIQHPGCPGKHPWQLYRNGWIYVCTGAGPNADLIKVGSTGINPSERVAEYFMMSDAYPAGANANNVMVWAAFTEDDRLQAEHRVHKKLSADRVKEFGREIFRTPLPIVLEVLAEVVSSMIEQYAWSSIFGGYAYGYPVMTRARLDQKIFQQTKEIEKQSQQIREMMEELEALKQERAELQAAIARLMPAGDSSVRH